ncbi:1-phosphatidylinositol 3-phosphate 5-kinase-like [Ptychodera flava]|uniref:1-phosphatidylinositol 3-phosphate 5-kinase-like n=1 Tax=Ptychodera flava TaxID=63121 RepID=UPI00396A8043
MPQWFWQTKKMTNEPKTVLLHNVVSGSSEEETSPVIKKRLRPFSQSQQQRAMSPTTPTSSTNQEEAVPQRPKHLQFDTSGNVRRRNPSNGSPGNIPRENQPSRTLTTVLKRLSSLIDAKSQVYRDSDFKQYWMPDSNCKECYDCGDKFTTFRRRHHCRVCGQIFCNRCCNQEVPGKFMGYSGNLRVCTYCCKVVLSYAQSADGNFRALHEDLSRVEEMSADGVYTPSIRKRAGLLYKEDDFVRTR